MTIQNVTPQASSFIWEDLEIALLTDRTDGPVLVSAAEDCEGARLPDWTRAHRAQLDSLMVRHKALLFRGFCVDTVNDFQAFLAALGANLLEYSERSTPRSTVQDRVYTSTEYPKSDEIPMHNENSYSLVWPRRIGFCCLLPAVEGGATPIADSRMVYEGIDASIRQSFVDKKVMYVRNYGLGVDLTWQDAFQTEEREKVEKYCRDFELAYEWFDDGAGLHTEQVRPAALRFLPTGETVWFNQAHLFHISSLPPALRLALCDVFPPHRLPRNSCYGDGSPIDETALDEIRRVYKDAQLLIEWTRGDVLLLDNLFYAHGRLPFKGDRKVVVAMDTVGGTDTAPL
jgi:hypothetical protein